MLIMEYFEGIDITTMVSIRFVHSHINQELQMIAFDVQDMTCGHCVATITKALQAADSQATVRIDLPQHRVEVESAKADPAQIRQAISEAGFTPVPLPSAG